MLVLLLMGLAAGYVVFNAFGVSQVDQLEQQARRLQVIVDMASDYAVLNQRELGLRFEEKDNSYFFVYLDEDDKWQRVEDELYQAQTLPEPFTFTLNLDDLPWEEEEQLFDRELFDENLSVSEDAVEIGNEEDKPIPPPQVLIMSSGEITPFQLIFNYEPGFGDDDPAYFVLSNQDMPPLALEGPLEQPE
ncbi:type II secretion system protein GspH [Alteromonas aestuariivivens]|uniref:Type II secretion system protein GspH n=2 Tax=Alteromonas aestuariivivens TaxID=1938339 RepID=A0A3D8M5L9_9ALTE|nr:type II secretion system protein GspH [Alteromonas aestuariivivens]